MRVCTAPRYAFVGAVGWLCGLPVGFADWFAFGLRGYPVAVALTRARFAALVICAFARTFDALILVTVHYDFVAAR